MGLRFWGRLPLAGSGIQETFSLVKSFLLPLRGNSPSKIRFSGVKVKGKTLEALPPNHRNL
ncbi:hypothetical protein [Acutalibacter sp. 1XD8-33]|uniref:hypothetical protein n=1 Tax=Acutalibacter sp. 1XD8-33 TaxID=2320081 RepID=UPI001A9B4A33|nr:hypothetical protein [Acutalibacter sp. 1XD8-33]